MQTDLVSLSSPTEIVSPTESDFDDTRPLDLRPSTPADSDREADSDPSHSEGSSDARSPSQSTASSVSSAAEAPVLRHCSQSDGPISTPATTWDSRPSNTLTRPDLTRSSSDFSSAAASTSALTTASETTQPPSSHAHSAYSALGPRISFVGPIRPGDRPAPKPFRPPRRASIQSRSRSTTALAGSTGHSIQSTAIPPIGSFAASTSDSSLVKSVNTNGSSDSSAFQSAVRQDKMDGVVHPHPEQSIPLREGGGGRGGAGASDRSTPKRLKRPQTAPAEGSSFGLKSFRSFVSSAKYSLRRRPSQAEEAEESFENTTTLAKPSAAVDVPESPATAPPTFQLLDAAWPRALTQSPASELEEYLQDEHDGYGDGQRNDVDIAGPSREAASPAFRAYYLPVSSENGGRSLASPRKLPAGRRPEGDAEGAADAIAIPGPNDPSSQDAEKAPGQLDQAASISKYDVPTESPSSSDDTAVQSLSTSSALGSRNLDPSSPEGLYDRRSSRQESASGSSSVRSLSLPGRNVCDKASSSRRASTAISEADGFVCPTPPLAFPPPPRPFYKGTLLLVRDNVILDDDNETREVVLEDDSAGEVEGEQEAEILETVSGGQERDEGVAVTVKETHGGDAISEADKSHAREAVSTTDSDVPQGDPVRDSPKRERRRPQTAPGGSKTFQPLNATEGVVTSPFAPSAQLDLPSGSFSSPRRSPGANHLKARTTDPYALLERVDEHHDESTQASTVLWSGQAQPQFDTPGGQLREKMRLKNIKGFVRRLFSARSSYDAGVGTVDAVLGKGGVAQQEDAEEEDDDKRRKKGRDDSRIPNARRAGLGPAPAKKKPAAARKSLPAPKRTSTDVGVEAPTIVRIVSRDSTSGRPRTSSLRNQLGSPGGVNPESNSASGPSRMSNHSTSTAFSPILLPSPDERSSRSGRNETSSPLPLSLRRTRTGDSARSEFGARCDTPTSILSTSTSTMRQGGERRDSLARRETPWEDVDSFRRMQKKMQQEQEREQDRQKRLRSGSSLRRPATMERNRDGPSYASAQSVEKISGTTKGGRAGEEKKQTGRRPRTMEGRVEGHAQRSAWTAPMEEKWGGQGGGETGAEFFL
ncbi:unnamed protein product [Tilletia controversa]|uniref:Uncharacterized protein n=1 Tax=Tilletia controversa TaxID=13291 RepID=A0A8X7MY36_9BASI|nr:hypothetical protein CF328_g1904 [Tilletia controversa]KAE8252364.1 hypothetical protein A4X06_0g2242 [Tilletia controversa]CAD6918559.1 unnamed protein product [Tilletia controversa]CAD6919775.1 unnamed protein product [Tilletia controversa]CAD6949150.1 unnamed protein product [Tilletia controversa]